METLLITISGFILNILGSLPKEKEAVEFNEYKFVVERVLRNRILKVRIEKKQSDMKDHLFYIGLLNSSLQNPSHGCSKH